MILINPLHPNISMHILHTVLFTLPNVLTRRICLTFESFFSKWSLSLFSWLCVIQRRYCKEKLDDNHSLESKGLTLFSKWKGFISHLHRPLNKYWTVDEIIFYMLFKLALYKSYSITVKRCLKANFCTVWNIYCQFHRLPQSIFQIW